MSSRYAKALLLQALEIKKLDVVYKDIQIVQTTCEDSKELSELLKNPIVSSVDKQEVCKKVFGKSISSVTLNFIDIVISKGRDGLIKEIADSFIKLYNQHKGVSTVSLTTASKVDAGVKNDILKKLSINPSEVEIIEKIDKSLIGGYILRLGDRQIDASIKNKLNQLKKEFIYN